jgi:RNA polymerase sigma factor (sigma-70 family)
MATPFDAAQEIELAVKGDINALHRLLTEVKNPIYRISLRMLGNIEDAEDATQEILLKVTTALSTFRGDSKFQTWVHRIAVNHILSELRQKSMSTVSLDQIANDLDRGLAYSNTLRESSSEDATLAYEVFVTCTQSLLSALDSDERIAYVLGDLCDIPGAEAAQILDINPAAFRQRLSRARATLANFANQQCGVTKPANPCRCAKQVPAASVMGYVDEATLKFSLHPVQTPLRRIAIDEVSNALVALVIVLKSPGQGETRWEILEASAKVFRKRNLATGVEVIQTPK